MQEKPGYKTTEFWLKVAAILVSAVLASGLLPPESTVLKIVATVATILGALGYTGARVYLKARERALSMKTAMPEVKDDHQDPAASNR
jgi:hypothetical protein